MRILNLVSKAICNHGDEHTFAQLFRDFRIIDMHITLN